MAKITFAGAAAVYAFPGENTMLTLKIYNNISKPIAGIKAQFQVFGNDLGSDAGTVDCGYALGSEDAFAELSIPVAVTKTVAAYLVPPANLTQLFAPGVRAVPLNLRCTVKYTDGTLFGMETVLENVFVLNYRYVPRIENFSLLRSGGGMESDEGVIPMASLKLSLRDTTMTSFMNLRLHYAGGAAATIDSPYIDLTAQIPCLLAGVISDTELIDQTFSNGSNWNFLLVFGDGYESASARQSFARAFANLHLSGQPTGGACFGGFSASVYGKPMLESHYEGFFHKGIHGVNNFCEEETLTGGRWIDDKPIYRRVIALPEASAGRTSTDSVATIEDLDRLIDFYGLVQRSTGMWYPLSYRAMGNVAVYAVDVYVKKDGGVVLRTGTSTALSGGHMVCFYTKASDEPIARDDGYASFLDSEGNAFAASGGISFKTEVY